MRRAPVAIALLAALLLAGCGLLPGGSDLEARDANESFELLLRVGSARHAAGQPIDLTATLSYLGPDPGVDLVGSGSGLISFRAKQLDGRLDIGGASRADCQTYRLDRGRPMVEPYSKSGGWSNDDPDAAFYRTFFSDGVLRLPAGRWQISASAEFTVKECGGVSRALDAQVTIVVE